MNLGQFEHIYGVLCEIRDLLKAQQGKPTIIAVPNDANAMQLMQELNNIGQLPTRKGEPPTLPTMKRGRGRPKKGMDGNLPRS